MAIKGKLAVVQQVRTKANQPKYLFQDLGSMHSGLTKSEMQEVARRFNQYHSLLNMLAANSPYGEDTFLPEFECTIKELRDGNSKVISS